MVLLQATDDFDVAWKRPEDASRTWRWDEERNPRPLVPMSQEFWPLAFGRFGQHIVIVNGFVFRSGPFSALPRFDSPPGAEAWEREFGPRTEALVDGIRHGGYARMTTVQLLDTVERLPDVYSEVMTNTMIVFFGIQQDAERLYTCL